MVELNKVYCMDNLELLKQLPDNYIDLIYCDILYGTGRNFGDYQDLKCVRKIIEEHYIPRIKEMYRILKPTGSIYLQMDYRISHWIRCLMDDIFGYNNFVNEIIWAYRSGGKAANKFSLNHDNILFYSKTNKYIFNAQKDLSYLPKMKGRSKFENDLGGFYAKCEHCDSKNVAVRYVEARDFWEFNMLSCRNSERTGYSTQKPKALLERIIKASSNEGDIVADFYMGSGTSMVVAKELNRQFIGCDISQKAVDITNQRIVQQDVAPKV